MKLDECLKMLKDVHECIELAGKLGYHVGTKLLDTGAIDVVVTKREFEEFHENMRGIIDGRDCQEKGENSR